MFYLTEQGKLIGELCNCNLADFNSWCDHNSMVLHTLFLLEPSTPFDRDALFIYAEYRIFCELLRQGEAQKLGLSLNPVDRPN